MKKLYLIGTNHVDQKGPERLMKLLNKYRPDYICMETSRDMEWYEELHVELTNVIKTLERIEELTKIELKHIKKFLEIGGYEVFVPLEYRQKDSHVKLKSFDMKPGPSEGKTSEYWIRIEEIANLLSKVKSAEDVIKAVKILLEDEKKMGERLDQKKMNKMYQTTHVKPEDKDHVLKYAGKRDVKIEIEMRNLFTKARAGDTIIYIGGLLHFFGDYSKFSTKRKYLNIYERLQDLKPERIRLIDADKL